MLKGTRVNQFEILDPVGSGGMGQVFRARDTKLGRDVAIKALPPEFADDADRSARLEREAKALAAVSHPNIASIHELLEHEGTRLLVLELVGGKTLGERLEDGPLPVRQSIEIAEQIANALEAAHERGVIHRDLKPANVMLTPDGLVKVLDFGLAKSTVGTAPASGRYETDVGAVLGTAPYMSPEQARGEEAGRQADIWSFGVMLYEMLTGQSPFERPSTPETIAHVLVSEPDLDALPATTPPLLRRLIQRCLEKSPRRRLKDFGDVRIDLEDALVELDTPPVAAGMSTKRSWLGLAVAALVAVAMGATAMLWLRDDLPLSRNVVRLALPNVLPRYLQPFGVESVAIADDGSHVAYASNMGLRIHSLVNDAVIAIDANAWNPFFSPDGEWVGFFGDSRLSIAPIDSASTQIIAESTERPIGASWGVGGTIVFAMASGLYSVPGDGSGSPVSLARPDRERGQQMYAWPEMLPAGDAVIFTIVPEDTAAPPSLALLELDSLEQRLLLPAASGARLTAAGHLLFIRNNELMAVEFDPATRRLGTNPVAVAGVSVSTSADNKAANYDVASNGTLVHIAATAEPVGAPRELVWIDRDGNEEVLPLPPSDYVYPRVSPDGTRVAYELGARGNRDIWLYDLRRMLETRFTTGPTEDMLAAWSPDSSRIYFASDRAGDFDIYSKPADGSTDPRVELARPGFENPMFFTPAGELFVFEEFSNVSVLDLNDKSVRPLLHRESVDVVHGLSSDGNWAVYESNETGQQWEVFVRPFPNVMERREQVSIAGGRYPMWGPPGTNELYYVDLEGQMMAVPVEFEPDLSLGAPVRLFDTLPPPEGLSGRPYDLSMIDGRFLMTRFLPLDRAALSPPTVSVVLNWLGDLERQIAAQN